MHTLFISHDQDVVVAYRSIDAPQKVFKSVKQRTGRPPKNLGTDVATPQRLIETPQMLLGIKDKRRQ